MVIVGTKIPNFHGGELRMRYFIGIYKKNKNGKTIDLHTIDTDVIDLGLIKTEVLKGYDKIYTKNRIEDLKSKENFNKLKHSYISKEEAKDIGVIGAELIKQMELNKKNQKAIDEAIQKIQDAEEPNITPEEAAK